jgi:PKD repeat protein
MSTAGRGIAYGEPTGSTVSVSGISVSPIADTINVNETLQIEAAITPSNATNQSVSWNSSDASVASVNTSGLVSGLVSGTVTITATTYDGGYVASCQVTVIGSANTAPVAEITASVSGGSAPLVVSFDAGNSYDNDNDELSYLWDFGDGTQSTEVSLEHTFSTKGSYTVLLTVEDSYGLSDTASVQITVTGDDVTQYTLTTTVSGSGSIDLDPSGGTYDSATVVTATAVAGSGYHFVSWSGDASGSDASTTITMDADKSIAATFEQDSTGSPCDTPDTISVPFSHSGAGEYCFVTSDAMGYVNSWATDKVEINGVDYTNSWTGEMPDAIDGLWYIHFVGSYDWSGLEIGNLKSTTSAGVIHSDTEIQIYPNPFTSNVNIAIADPEKVRTIEVLNNLGRTILRLSGNQINNFVEWGEGLSSGTYYIKVYGENTHQAFIILKE